MNHPIFITGCSRSGLSLTANVFASCGAFGGEACRMDFQHSTFDNPGIKRNMIVPMMRRLRADPSGQAPLPARQLPFIDTQLGDNIQTILRLQGYKAVSPWFLKSNCLLLTWRQWWNAFPGARWVLVRRDMDGVVNSCLKTGYMRAFSDATGWQEWYREYELRMDDLKKHCGQQVTELWPGRVFAGDVEHIKQAVSWSGLQWDENRIRRNLPRLLPAIMKQEAV